MGQGFKVLHGTRNEVEQELNRLLAIGWVIIHKAFPQEEAITVIIETTPRTVANDKS